ncbi:MAG: sugar phosphate nucleotidyltransferase [Sandaracinaceae bacterium]
MPILILAGGRGTRLMEETRTVPKPMVTVGDTPILVHIMRYYAHHGFRKFVILLGYKGYIIKDYFRTYGERIFDLIVNVNAGKASHRTLPTEHHDDWEVVLAETGEHSMTARRLHLAARYVDAPVFGLTYGDGVADVDLRGALSFHQQHGCLGTVTAVHPPSRFGRLVLGDGSRVDAFREKETLANDFINGGYFFFNREFLSRLDESNIPLETAPLTRLAEEGQLHAFKHEGFWQPMDTLRDRQTLEDLYERGEAPWHVG